MNDSQLLPRLQNVIDASIPIAVQMGLKLETLTGNCLTLRVPLQPNANDKGTAFAGSIDSAVMLAGWTLAMVSAMRSGIAEPWAAVVHAETDFSAPLVSDFTVQAKIIEIKHKFPPRLKVTVECRIGDAVRYRGIYMAGEKTS